MLASSWSVDAAKPFARAGLRVGERGTHTSRTIMLSELSELLSVVPPGADRNDYERAVVDENVLGKPTMATRRMTSQRLAELYGLDRALPLFRVLRRVWGLDESGRPLIAMLCALARDPLLRATAPSILSLHVGAELVRSIFLEALREQIGPRLNDATLDKVARNAASSWSQSGHLRGRVRKIRTRVTPTPGSLSIALWLGALEGTSGEALLECRWTRVLDARGAELLPVALQARQLGLIHARAGDVVEIDASRLDAPLESS